MNFFSIITSLFCINVLFANAGDDFVQNGKIHNELTTDEYLAILSPFLPENPRILEAGAHSGEDTVLLGGYWPKGHIFAFEPVEKFYNNLLENLRKHKISNVSSFPIGLFSTSGERTFYYSQNCGGASSFLPDHGVVEYNDMTLTLPCKNLDEWANEHGVDSIDFMWLDMEGGEYYMLSTAPKILSTTRVILSEINFREFRTGSTQYETLKTFLEEQGFVLHMIWGSPYWQATGLFVRAELLKS